MIIVVPVAQQSPGVDQPIIGGGLPPRLTATWTSWTGDQWEITDPRSPVFALQGATGLRGAELEHWWRDVPTIDGSSWGGMRVNRGEIFIPMRIEGATLDDFLSTHAAFMRSLDPRQESTLRVTLPNGDWREIACRYESGMDAAIEPDPLAVRRATYGVTWATADPYWTGDPISLTFNYEDPVPFLDPPGPPIYLNSGRSLANAQVTNPGDVDSYGVWRVNGPYTGFTVGVAGDLLSATVTKGVGGWVEIDTRPGYRTVLDESGADAWAYLTRRAFPAVPPGEPVSLTTTILNPGAGSSVEVSFPAKYRSAWA